MPRSERPCSSRLAQRSLPCRRHESRPIPNRYIRFSIEACRAHARAQ
jgi:hypothetical protein